MEKGAENRNKTFIQLFIRLSEDETMEFIRVTAFWKRNLDFKMESCIFYNFGYERDIPYSQIVMTAESDFLPDYTSHGMQIQTGCSFVLIAGKYLNEVDSIMEKIDAVGDKTEFIPWAVYLFQNYENENISINSTLRSKKFFTIFLLYILTFRDDFSPAMFYVPTRVSGDSFIYKIMCAGGVVNRSSFENDDEGVKIYNPIIDDILMFRNGSSPLSYAQVCPVDILIKFFIGSNMYF